MQLAQRLFKELLKDYGPRPTAHDQRAADHGPRPTTSGRRPTTSGRRTAGGGRRAAGGGRRTAGGGRRAADGGRRAAGGGRRAAGGGRRTTDHGPAGGGPRTSGRRTTDQRAAGGRPRPTTHDPRPSIPRTPFHGARAKGQEPGRESIGAAPQDGRAWPTGGGAIGREGCRIRYRRLRGKKRAAHGGPSVSARAGTRRLQRLQRLQRVR